MTRRALVTGITGFIGGELAKRLLSQGWKVDAIVRPTSDTDSLPFGADVTFHTVEDGQSLTATVADARPDVVFHLASLYLAEHRPDQIEALVRSNILLPAMLAEAMTANGVRRLVNTGTAWQHFGGDGCIPVNLYAATKQAAEDMLRYYCDARQLSVVTLKLFDTFGRADTRWKLVQILIEAARSGETIDMSPGEQVVDLTHVDDVVSAFLLMAERLLVTDVPLNESYFVSGQRLTVRELSALVSEVLDRPIAANFGGRPYRAREVMRPVEPLSHETVPGWRREKTLEREIPEMLSQDSFAAGRSDANVR